MREKYQIHVHLSNECLRMFVDGGKSALVQTEQILISGVNQDGDTVGESKIMDQLDG